MIKFIEHGIDLPKLAMDVALIKIVALYNAYGIGASFLSFWQQHTDDKNLTAIICSFDGNFTVWANCCADFLEIAEFLAVVCENEIFCSSTVAEKLKLRVQSEHTLYAVQAKDMLRCRIRTESLTNSAHNKSAQLNLKCIYNMLLMGLDGNIDLPNFEFFCTDFSHRMRHGYAGYFANQHSIAIASAIYLNQLLIGEIATNLEYRKKGFGSSAVRGLAQNNTDKMLLVLAGKETHKFYESMSFNRYDTYTICKGIR